MSQIIVSTAKRFRQVGLTVTTFTYILLEGIKVL